MTLIARLTLVCCLAFAPVLASAQEGQSTTQGQSTTRPITPIAAARLTISLHQYAAAEQILAAILKETPDSTDALFLMAESKSEQGKFADAIPYYRKILAAHPDLVRVRLDLARAEFETGDDEGSDYNFRLALAEQGLPDTVVDNIGHYLSAIQSRKTFTYSVNLSAAPDSNMNAAAASKNITLFGLPFELSQNSTQKSGIGVTSTLSGEYFTPLATNLRLRTGGLFYSELYPGHSQFDDIQARATIGPQWLFNGADASLLAVVGKRWYGGSPYNESVGGRAEGDYSITKQLQLSSYLEGTSDSYHTQQFYNGYTLDQGNFLTYYFSPRMLVRLIAGLGYQGATTDAYEDWYWHLGFGVQFEFPWGITAYAQPDVKIGYWSGVDPLFGVRRLDRLYGGKIAAYKRDWEVLGFSPVLSVTYTDNRSNIPIYKFHRIQAQIGVTRQF
jgi:outer membrane protein